MKRQPLIIDGIQYLEYMPNDGNSAGLINYYHGTGGCGSDINKVDSEYFPGLLAAGKLEIPYTVICPQLPARYVNGVLQGWNENDFNPIIRDLLPKYNLDKHLVALSLGGMSFQKMLSNNPGVFKTVSVIAGKSDTLGWNAIPSPENAAMPELVKLSSIFFYGTADTQIPNGYNSMLNLANILKSKGADNTWVPYAGMVHNIWPQSFTDYFVWLSSKVAPLPKPVPDPVLTWTLLNGVLIGTTESGKTVNVDPSSIS